MLSASAHSASGPDEGQGLGPLSEVALIDGFTANRLKYSLQLGESKFRWQKFERNRRAIDLVGQFQASRMDDFSVIESQFWDFDAGMPGHRTSIAAGL